MNCCMANYSGNHINMDIKLMFFSFVNILIRVPPLVFLDLVFQSRIADLELLPCSLLPLHKEADFDTVTGELNHTLLQPYHSLDNYASHMFQNLSQSLVNVIEYDVSHVFGFLENLICRGWIGVVMQIMMLTLACLITLFTSTLWTKHMAKAYRFLFSTSLLYLGYQLNQKLSICLMSGPGSSLNIYTKERIISCIGLISGNFVLQLTLAAGYIALVGHYVTLPNCLRKLTALSFVLPSVMSMLPFDTYYVIVLCTAFLAIHNLCVIFQNITLICKAVNERIYYVATYIENEGAMAFVEAEWFRLNIPLIVRSFWFIRCGIFIGIYLHSSTSNTWSDLTNLKMLLQILLIRGCESFPALLGMSAVFSWMCTKIYNEIQRFMLIPLDESFQVGPISSIVLFALCYQYGLTGLKPASRIVRLLRLAVLTIACLSHFIHNAIDPVLMSLAASANKDYHRHARALGISCLLVVITTCSLLVLWTSYSTSTWLLAVSGFGVEVVCKIVISVSLYGLFLVDALHQEFWEELDDHVYRIKFTGRIVELVVGLCMLSNSGFALVFESGSSLRAFLFGLQGYFTLWGEARIGWKIFTRRRTAVRKIATLDTVYTPQKTDDTCTICFHDLHPSQQNNVVVKVTRCQHYFHAVCLRKWLYVQDRCPMCHQTLWPELSDHVPRNRDGHAHID